MPGRPTSSRKLRGAYYTPPALVDFLVREVLEPAFAGRSEPPSVLDPACGDGRILHAAGAAIRARFGVDPRPYLHGVELDAATAEATAADLGAAIHVGDGRRPVPGAPFDVVLGNPPYLSQLAAATSRGGRSALGGGPYADSAAEFLVAALQAVRPGGRIGLVLPVSILATRDVAPIRGAVEAAGALDVWWWADQSVFDAAVRTGILGIEVGGTTRPVRRWHGPHFDAVTSAEPESGSGTWSWLIADVAGVPLVAPAVTHGVLGDLAVITADFRDQYYGLVGAVSDAGTGPPLVTSGLIDPGRNRWGERPARFAKARYAAPRVDLAALTPEMRAWAERRLVPKVLVASQTKVVEAVVDEAGAWLPGVPVVSVVPRRVEDLWRVAAVLTSPVTSAWLAQRRLGSGLSAGAVRVTAKDLAQVPLPGVSSAWDAAVERLRAGDVMACGGLMAEAYGVGDDAGLLAWWHERVGAAG